MSNVSEGIMRGLMEAVKYSEGNLEARTIKREIRPKSELQEPKTNDSPAPDIREAR